MNIGAALDGCASTREDFDAMLEMERLTKTYRTRQGHVVALDGITLTAGNGDFVAIQGPSGSGKTTLLLAAGGLLAPDSGRIAVDGRDIYAMPSDRRARFRAETIGFVFQQFHLVGYLTVLENVLLPSVTLGARDLERRARDLIERFNLGHRMHHLPSELSTGERQRTALARALLNEPSLLLADEPTGNLDSGNAGEVIGAMREFARSGGSVMLVTHDGAVAAAADTILRLVDGALEDDNAA